jgi:hypothetical protein
MRNLAHIAFLAIALIAGSAVTLRAALCNQGSDLTRPIELGAAGGNINSQTVSNGTVIECCYGTLGALVKGPGGQYILSNNHVLSRVNRAQAGEGIIQPGLAQDGCPASPPTEDIVAHLSASSKINFGVHAKNKIDAAIARVVSGDVSADILNIGPISNKVAPAVPKLAVQKMGASSCLTQGTIQTINFSTAQIQYPDECDSNSGTANFVKQIVVKAVSGNFASPGDSGSLVVTTDTCPRPVGLLFAADNAGDVFVNPMKTVLGAFGVSIVAGCTAATSAKTGADADALSSIAGDANSTAAASAPDESAAEEAAAFANITGLTMQAVNFAVAAQTRHEKDLLAIADVAGVGVGASDQAGVPSIDVYVAQDSPELRADLPTNLEGLPLKVIVGGPIHAL